MEVAKYGLLKMENRIMRLDYKFRERCCPKACEVDMFREHCWWWGGRWNCHFTFWDGTQCSDFLIFILFGVGRWVSPHIARAWSECLSGLPPSRLSPPLAGELLARTCLGWQGGHQGAQGSSVPYAPYSGAKSWGRSGRLRAGRSSLVLSFLFLGQQEAGGMMMAAGREGGGPCRDCERRRRRGQPRREGCTAEWTCAGAGEELRPRCQSRKACKPLAALCPGPVVGVGSSRSGGTHLVTVVLLRLPVRATNAQSEAQGLWDAVRFGHQRCWFGEAQVCLFNLLLSTDEVNSICKDAADRDFDVPGIVNTISHTFLAFVVTVFII